MSAVTRNITLLVIAAAAIQTAALAYMIWDRAGILKHGRQVILQTTPVDPRSLFRGDYVILRFDISTINTLTLKRADRFKRGDTIYVSLSPKPAQQGKPASWQAIAAHLAPPALDGKTVIVKGKVRSAWPWRRRTTPGDATQPATPATPWCGTKCQRLDIRYGIETYFVPEGTGTAIEKQRNKRQVYVIVRVGKKGNAAIAGLNIDGEKTIVEPLL